MSELPPPAPTAEDVASTAHTAGLNVSSATAARMAVAVAPALAAFAKVSATLPFDLDPSAFLSAQRPQGESR